MRMPTWVRLVGGVIASVWMGCAYAWATIVAYLHTEPDTAMILGATIGLGTGPVAPLANRLRLDAVEARRDELPAAHRALVDEALATGELTGGEALHQLERGLARARLADQGSLTRPQLDAVRAVLALVPLVPMAFAQPRPGWLVSCTVATACVLLAYGVWAWRRPGRGITPDERARLRHLTPS